MGLMDLITQLMGKQGGSPPGATPPYMPAPTSAGAQPPPQNAMSQPPMMPGIERPQGNGAQLQGTLKENGVDGILANQIGVPEREKAPAWIDQKWYKDSDKMSALFASLSNGLGNMTLRGNGGMRGMNNMLIQSGMQGVEDNKTMKYLAENNPEMFRVMANLPPNQRGDYMKLAMQYKFQDPKDQWAMIPTSENAKYGLPPDKPYRVNTTNGKVEAIGGGGTVVNNNTRERLPTPPAGYENVLDEDGNLISQRVIPGGPVEAEQAELAEKTANRGKTKANAASTVVSDIERSIELVENGNASNVFGDWYEGIPGVGPVMDVLEGATAVGLSKVPGGRTDANKALQLSESARSNIGIDSLQTMRENSPTGGALGQVPFQQQQRLEQLYGQLNPVQMSPEEYKFNANRVINLYSDIIYGNAADRERLVAEGKLSAQQNREIEKRYKPMTRDSSGRPFDISAPPPDFDLSPQQWMNADEDTRLRAWNRYERKQVPNWYEL